MCVRMNLQNSQSCVCYPCSFSCRHAQQRLLNIFNILFQTRQQGEESSWALGLFRVRDAIDTMVVTLGNCYREIAY